MAARRESSPSTLDFLKTILPEHGIHYLALFQEGHRFPGHKVYLDLETMADAIDNMAGSKSVSVYHACASYQRAVIEVEDGEKTKRKYRVPENWDRAKSFWVDLDCGQEKFDKGDGYARLKIGQQERTEIQKTLSSRATSVRDWEAEVLDAYKSAGFLMV